MKKTLWMLAVLMMCLLPAGAWAQDYELDDRTVLSGMDKSWLQGYEPTASGESLTICLPIRSEASDGKLTATLVMDDEALSPIRTQKLSAVFWRSEGMFQVKLNFKLASGRVNGDYTGRVLLEGKDKEGNALYTEYPVTIRIRDGKTDEGMKPEIRSVSAELSPGAEGNVSVSIANPGRITPMENVTLTVEDENGNILPAGADTLKVGRIAPGGEAVAEYPVVIGTDPAGEYHRLKITLRYTALDKEEQWEDTFTVPAGGGQNVPTPEINDISAQLIVGEAGTVSAEIVNPDAGADMENVLLTVTDSENHVLPAGSDVIRLGNIAPGGGAKVDCQVLVVPDASVSLHRLTFRLTYRQRGQDKTWEESFTLPVEQEVRLEQGGVQMASSIIQGDMATLTLPLMNMGRGELLNVMATLNMPGVVERQSVLVGSIGPGETKEARISFTPGKNVLGDMEGQVTVTAEDAWGNEISFDLPVSITVEEPVKVSYTDAREEEEEKPDYLLHALMGGCGLLVLLLILQGALLRRKIHRLEEDRL